MPCPPRGYALHVAAGSAIDRVLDATPGPVEGVLRMLGAVAGDVAGAADVLGVVNGHVSADPFAARDPEYIERTLPALRLLSHAYFRGEVRGLRNIPARARCCSWATTPAAR